MMMKNKLYKHHKSKSFFMIRNFSFAVVALLGVGLTIAIPTYISSIKEQQISAKAQAEESVEEEAEIPEIENLLNY